MTTRMQTIDREERRSEYNPHTPPILKRSEGGQMFTLYINEDGLEDDGLCIGGVT